MNLLNQPARAVPKPSFPRNKPTARQRGLISTKVRRQLRERSGGICERCHYAPAAHACHLVRRWLIQESTTVEFLAHLCVPCHQWADSCKDGRSFLEEFLLKLLEESTDGTDM